MDRISFDHCVIHVSDWERSNAFYREVLGADVVPNGAGFVYRIGAVQLNCHGPGLQPDPKARLPVPPGGSDLCFRWDGPIDDAARPSRGLRDRGRARPRRALRPGRQGHERVFPRSRRLADGVHQLR